MVQLWFPDGLNHELNHEYLNFKSSVFYSTDKVQVGVVSSAAEM
jgi:hypothetical protein